MSVFGIYVDTWAVGKETTYATMTIQAFCVLLSLTLISIQIYCIVKKKDELKSNWKRSLLLLTQLTMMCISTLYMVIHFWNYMMLYFPYNPIECHTWYTLIVSTFGLSRICLMTFLMLRSSFAFEGTFCELSIKITGTVIAVNTIGNLILVPMITHDSIPISPVAGKGFCSRILDELAEGAYISFHAFNSFTSIVALVIFYWKARSVRKMLETMLKEKNFSDRMGEVDKAFKKHIKLGMLTVIGTIIMFFIAHVTSVLIGICFAFDQTLNNVLTFIMFKDNEFAYKWLCKPFKWCRLGKSDEINEINHSNMLRTSLQNIPQSDLPTNNSEMEQSQQTKTKSTVSHDTQIVIR